MSRPERILAFPGEPLERVEQRGAEQQQGRHHASHQQVHLAPQRKHALPGEHEDEQQEERGGDEGRPRLGAQHDGEVQPAEQQPSEPEIAEVFQRGGEDGGDAEAGQERRRVQAVESAGRVEDRTEPDDFRNQAEEHAEERHQRHAPTERRPESMGGEGEGQYEGRGRADEAARHVAEPRDPADGEDHQAEAGDGHEDHEGPVDDAIDAVAEQQHASHGEGHHLDDGRAEGRRAAAACHLFELDIDGEPVGEHHDAGEGDRELVQGERGQGQHGPRQEHGEVGRREHGDEQQGKGAGRGDEPLKGWRKGGVHRSAFSHERRDRTNQGCVSEDVMTASSISATEAAGGTKAGAASAPRHDSLTRLRLALIGWVVLYHLDLALHVTGVLPWLRPVLGVGYLGVDGFFLLVGLRALARLRLAAVDGCCRRPALPAAARRQDLAAPCAGAPGARGRHRAGAGRRRGHPRPAALQRRRFRVAIVPGQRLGDQLAAFLELPVLGAFGGMGGLSRFPGGPAVGGEVADGPLAS